MMSKLKQFIQGFRRDEDGSLTTEAVIVTPVLLWAFMATFVFFDTFQAHSKGNKAAYTIGDMLSRETAPITPAYMDGAKTLLEFLSGVGAGDGSSLRVTVIRYDGDTQSYEAMWSQVRGTDFSALTTAEVSGMSAKLPIMVNAEQLILVETLTNYEPVVDVGLQPSEVETFVFTRPRFTPQLLWESS